MQRGSSLMSKLAGKPRYHDERGNRQWIHSAKALTDDSVVYQAKFLGFTEVAEPRGTDIVKEAIKKIQISHELRKSEAGKRGSKLQKVEVQISINIIKVIDLKTKEVITQNPLHRISYCADDHTDKKIFAFIAKQQETKTHHCFVVVTEKDAAELTVTVGQAFELAYKRYLEQGKRVPKEDKEVKDLRQQVANAAAENLKLKQQLEMQDKHSSSSTAAKAPQNNFMPPSSHQASTENQAKEPSLLVDWGGSENAATQQTQGFDPFDNYLSKLSISRGLGEAETPDHMQDRAPFQSPVQKNPQENPFNPKQSNPFDSFFASGDSTAESDNAYNGHSFVSETSGYDAPASRGLTPQGLPPPPTKQSIKAANASKMKGMKSPPLENPTGVPNDVNRNDVSNAFAVDLFNPQLSREESSKLQELNLGAGLQFESFPSGGFGF